MPDEDSPAPELGGKLRSRFRGWAGKQKICHRWEHVKAQAAQAIRQALARRHDSVAMGLEPGMILPRSHRSGERETTDRIGVETISDALQRLDQRTLADGKADAQTRKAAG